MDYEETFQIDDIPVTLVRIKQSRLVNTWRNRGTGMTHYSIKGKHVLLTYKELAALHLVKTAKIEVKKPTLAQRLKKWMR